MRNRILNNSNGYLQMNFSNVQAVTPFSCGRFATSFRIVLMEVMNSIVGLIIEVSCLYINWKKMKKSKTNKQTKKTKTKTKTKNKQTNKHTPWFSNLATNLSPFFQKEGNRESKKWKRGKEERERKIAKEAEKRGKEETNDVVWFKLNLNTEVPQVEVV